MDDRSHLASTADVADYLGLTIGTLDKWAHRRTGPTYFKVGLYRRYRWADVDAWLANQQVDTGDACPQRHAGT